MSFECHTDLALEGLFEELDEDEDQLDLDRVDAEIFKLLGLTKLCRQ